EFVRLGTNVPIGSGGLNSSYSCAVPGGTGRGHRRGAGSGLRSPKLKECVADLALKNCLLKTSMTGDAETMNEISRIRQARYKVIVRQCP
ncbi:hypothetical protein WG908_16455, partial [Sphingobium sp. AN641]|uniref:hypothetical protein n=1 Tax=Sphingobium sp. AN641 TaxID=3133443 RepID=UPI0030BD3345